MRRVFIISLLLVLPAGAGAQTVTVDASLGSPDNVTTFNSIQMAIYSFQGSGFTSASSPGGVGVNHGNAAPDIINVITTAVVDEFIAADAEATSGASWVVLDEALTIQGSGVIAVVALRQSGVGSTDVSTDGFAFRQDVDLTLRDIILIPSRTSTPTDDGLHIHATTHTADTVVTIENVVVTANNGSDAPVTTTGLDTPSLAGATGFGDDGVVFFSQTEGGTITLNATGLVISSFNTTTGGRDGLTAYMVGATNDIINCFVTLGPGCVISNCARFGIYNAFGASLSLAGTHDSPVILNNIVADGVWCNSDSAAPTQACILNVDHAIINNCGASGLKEQETRGRGFINSVSNSIISNCTNPGISLFAFGTRPAGVSDTVTISNVTVHNCGIGSTPPPANYDFLAAGIAAPRYQTTYRTNRNVSIQDTIVSGAGLTGLYNSSDGTFSIDYSSLVTAGPHALSAATGGPSTIGTGFNMIASDPQYVTALIGDFASTDYVDVANNDYAARGTAGSDLAGGADYVGGPASTPTPPPTPSTGVGHGWAVYR